MMLILLALILLALLFPGAMRFGCLNNEGKVRTRWRLGGNTPGVLVVRQE